MVDAWDWGVFASTWTLGGQLQLVFVAWHLWQQSQEVFFCRHLVKQAPQSGFLQFLQHTQSGWWHSGQHRQLVMGCWQVMQQLHWSCWHWGQTHSPWTCLQVLQHPWQKSTCFPQTLQQLQVSWDPLQMLQQLHELSVLDPPQVMQRCVVPGHSQFLTRHLQTWHLIIVACSSWGPRSRVCRQEGVRQGF